MKPWAYLAIAVALIAFVGSVYGMGRSAGYDKRSTELQNEIIEAQERTRLEEEEKWAAAVKAAQDAIKTEEVIVETIREIEIEIPTVVERIVEVHPECADLGDAYAGLLNNQVRAANSIQDPELAAGADDEVQ